MRYNSTISSNSENTTLTLESLLDLVKMLKVHKHPLEEFANSYGYSIDKGDMLILPKELYNQINMTHNNVYPSKLTDKLIFIKRESLVNNSLSLKIENIVV